MSRTTPVFVALAALGLASPDSRAGSAGAPATQLDLARSQVLAGDYAGLPDQDASPGPEFGHAVAVDGDWMAVGAPGTRVGPGAGEVRGAVFLFQREGGQWQLRQRLPGFGSWGPAPRCGQSVALRLPRLAFGCPGTEWPATPGQASGAVVVSRLTDGVWASPAGYRQSGTDGACGHAVALTPTVAGHPVRLAVGCPGSAGDTGEVRVLSATDTGNAWAVTHTLLAAGAGPGDRFGQALALRRTIAFDLVVQTLAVGAPGRPQGAAAGAGAVHLFEGGGFAPTGLVLMPNAVLFPQAGFGSAVAVTAGHLLVGAPGGPGGGSVCNTLPRCGSVYRYTNAGGTWQLADGGEVVNQGGNPPGGQSGMAFGAALALGHDGWSAFAAPLADGHTGTIPPGVAPEVGMVELRRAAGGGFSAAPADHRGELRPPPSVLGGSGQTRFGTALAFTGDGLAVGYPRAGGLLGARDGRVWVYRHDRLFADGFELP